MMRAEMESVVKVFSTKLCAAVVFMATCCDFQSGMLVADDRVDEKQAVDWQGEIAAVGLQGHYRVGRWTGIKLDKDSISSTIETRDGDGVRVRYSRPTRDSNWIYVVPGSEAAPLTAFDNDAMLQRARLPVSGSTSRGPSMVKSDMPWTLVFGDPLGVEKIGENELLNRDATVAVTVANSADELPDRAIGYDAIDVVMIGASGATVLSELSKDQQNAVLDWVHSGGRIALTLGQRSIELIENAPWLKELLPFEPDQTTKINPSAVETFMASQDRLETFEGLRIPRGVGKPLVVGRTDRRVITPIAAEFQYGFGSVVVIAADLESEPFASWPQRREFFTSLVGPKILPPTREEIPTNRLSSYNDLAGQLRMTLDQFSIKRGHSFSLLAITLLLLIAAIGPLDYLLVNRVLGKPLLGWLSFPLMAISVSAVLTYQAALPSEQLSSLECNRVEITDLDATSGAGQGRSINFVYSHYAGLFDIRFPKTESLSSITEAVVSNATSFGYPGESFGGIQISLEDSRLPSFRATASRVSKPSEPIVDGLPLAPRSSKGLIHQYSFTSTVADQTSLTRRPGSELLQGGLTNPLPFDLLDGMLIYRNWVYLLPTRLVAGGRIADLESLRQKNFRWLLSRQQAIESSSQSEAWDVSSRDDLDRLSEMLMFHKAVGGTAYTNLTSNVLERIDLSSCLTEERCILLGRVDTQMTGLSIDPKNDVQAQDAKVSNHSLEPEGKSLSIFRILLPVVNAPDRPKR